jgi:hypothetical protein
MRILNAAQAIIEQHAREKGLEKHNNKYLNRYPVFWENHLQPVRRHIQTPNPLQRQKIHCMVLLHSHRGHQEMLDEIYPRVLF